MKREERLSYWGIIVVMFFFLFHTCQEKRDLPELEVVKSRQVEYKTVIDTIPFFTEIKKTIYVKVPVPYIEETDPIDSSIVREYSSPYEDSLIKGNINVKVDGTLLAQSLYYEPKFPKYIIKTDSIIVTNTIKETLKEQPKTRLLIGASVLGSKTNVGIVPSLGLMDKRYTTYLVGYDFINKTVNITFSKPIIFKK